MIRKIKYNYKDYLKVIYHFRFFYNPLHSFLIFHLSDSTAVSSDQSLSSAKNDEKLSNPDVLDNFGSLKSANDTNDTTNTPTTEPSTSTAKSNFFDTFDINQFVNKSEEVTDQKSSNANTADLEESFGGSTEEPDPVVPTRPKTGVYFLVDWNTFLRVGEEGKDQVNLRFAPKVGDRSRFRSIQITKSASK